MVRTVARPGPHLRSTVFGPLLNHVRTFGRPCPDIVATVFAPLIDRVPIVLA